MEYVVEMLNIRKEFPGIVANDNITLQLKEGEVHALLGENGAGKSTLLRIIAGIDHDFSGTVKLGAGVSVGYFSQDSAEKINGSETILERLENKIGRAHV